MNKQKKDRLFQYAYESFWRMETIEDTELITEKEANTLWEKYYPDIIRRIKNEQKPQMAIWKNCKSNTDYHTVEKEIDWRDDLEVKNGIIYKTIKKKV